MWQRERLLLGLEDGTAVGIGAGVVAACLLRQRLHGGVDMVVAHLVQAQLPDDAGPPGQPLWARSVAPGVLRHVERNQVRNEDVPGALRKGRGVRRCHLCGRARDGRCRRAGDREESR